MKKIVLFIVLIHLTTLFKAQSDTNWLERFQERRKIKEQEGRFMITPLVGPGYTPELGFSLAGGILSSWKTDRSDTALQRSSLSVTIGASTTGAIFISAKPVTFWNHDKIRANMDFWFKDMPDNYYGVGYDNASSHQRSDSMTAYTRLWIQMNPQIFWQFTPGFFFGGALDLNYTHGRDASPGVADDPYYKQYNDLPRNVGLGLHVEIDTRDVAVNAWKGWYILLQGMLYGKYFGGENNYEVINLDVRHYIQLFKPGQTLAWQARGRFAIGDVPYGEMSQLGTPFDLRGYRWGQYRDKEMLFGIAEYRHTFYKKDGEKSKHGAVLWAGTGSVASDLEFQYWLPNVGLGYRLEVQPRMNLRLDMGFGKESRGFYFNFTEAF